MVTHLKAASDASNDVINMATININCSLVKAIVCIGIVVFNQHEHFFKDNMIYFGHMMVKWRFYVTLIINYFSIPILCMQNTV